MNPIILYALTVLIWGSTWLVIKFQLGVVPPTLSVAYRFLLASAVLFSYCLITKTSLKLNIKQHLRLIALGLLIFCMNYICTYYASGYLTSGLVAVIFSTITSINIINSRIFLNDRPSPSLLIGSAIGFSGIIAMFYHDIIQINPSHGVILGLGIQLLGTFFASCGNVLSVLNQKKGISIIPANTYGMFYGGCATLGISFLQGNGLVFDMSAKYILSLIYLSVFGSVIAFGAYFVLLKQIGPGRASYSAVMFPVVALVLSTIFEDFHWTPNAILGVTLILSGNFFIMKKKAAVK